MQKYRVKRYTFDSNLLIELEYRPHKIQKGEHVFLKINIFDRDDNQRTHHVDNDLIVRANKSDIFKTSSDVSNKSM
jgi:alpha-N-acetylglucosamine transferase